jgi:REP element-mobilizing transposase RayT
VHAVLRVRDDVTNLRGPVFSTLLFCFRAMKRRAGFRLVHFSVQSNHIHLIVEASDERALSRAMQSLAIRIARNLNQVLTRRGRVFDDHYFSEQLKGPRQVRHTLRYVFRNFEHHTGRKGPDGRASEMYLQVREVPPHAPVALPRTWLLTVGWRRIKGRPPDVAGSEGP